MYVPERHTLIFWLLWSAGSTAKSKQAPLRSAVWLELQVNGNHCALAGKLRLDRLVRLSSRRRMIFAASVEPTHNVGMALREEMFSFAMWQQTNVQEEISQLLCYFCFLCKVLGFQSQSVPVVLSMHTVSIRIR